MLPNAVPAIVTVLLFSFVWQWNDSFFTTTYLTSSKVMSTQLASLPYNLSIFLEGGVATNKDPFYQSMVQDTGILLAILPLIIIYLFVQRYFVESIERTGSEGSTQYGDPRGTARVHGCLRRTRSPRHCGAWGAQLDVPAQRRGYARTLGRKVVFVQSTIGLSATARPT